MSTRNGSSLAERWPRGQCDSGCDQKAFLRAFVRSPLAARYYLTAGTALAAFHLGHRLSEDLDLFAPEPAPLETLFSFLRGSGFAEPAYQHLFDRRLFLLPSRGPAKLKVEFTGYPFPSLGEKLTVEGLEVDSLRDILANKLVAMTERSDAKDFVDLYLGLDRDPSRSLDPLVDDAERKFGVKGLRHILAGRSWPRRRIWAPCAFVCPWIPLPCERSSRRSRGVGSGGLSMRTQTAADQRRFWSQ